MIFGGRERGFVRESSAGWDRADPFIMKTNVETFILKSKLSVFALEKVPGHTDVMILVRFMFLKLYQSQHCHQS